MEREEVAIIPHEKGKSVWLFDIPHNMPRTPELFCAYPANNIGEPNAEM